MSRADAHRTTNLSTMIRDPNHGLASRLCQWRARWQFGISALSTVDLRERRDYRLWPNVSRSFHCLA